MPKPDSITWFLHGFPLPTANNAHYSVKEESWEDGMRSELSIKNISKEEFGEFNCTVKNSQGEAHFIVKLEIQSKSKNSKFKCTNKYNQLFIFPIIESSILIITLSAIIGGIILTMFVIVLMVMCRRSSFGIGANSLSHGEKCHIKSVH